MECEAARFVFPNHDESTFPVLESVDGTMDTTQDRYSVTQEPWVSPPSALGKESGDDRGGMELERSLLHMVSTTLHKIDGELIVRVANHPRNFPDRI